MWIAFWEHSCRSIEKPARVITIGRAVLNLGKDVINLLFDFELDMLD